MSFIMCTRNDVEFVVDKEVYEKIIEMVCGKKGFPIIIYNTKQNRIIVKYNEYGSESIKCYQLARIIMGIEKDKKKSVIYKNFNLCDLRKDNLIVINRSKIFKLNKKLKDKDAKFFKGCVKAS